MGIIDNSLQEKKMPDFKPGDRVRILTKFKEGEEIRKHRFEGIVIGRRGQGTGETFTVRKVTAGCGVEHIFPTLSPTIEKMEVLKKGKVKRAKLYYLRKQK
ncbi:MAG: 50S ribosomal protein L19 [Candidatus Stahlbacteria bacterium]|nr:50S ribosomal protein L19 [Candidatus Stahlbacteria bacterium]